MNTRRTPDAIYADVSRLVLRRKAHGGKLQAAKVGKANAVTLLANLRRKRDATRGKKAKATFASDFAWSGEWIAREERQIRRHARALELIQARLDVLCAEYKEAHALQKIA